MTSSTLGSTAQALANEYDLALLDLDGVILFGDRLVNKVADVLQPAPMRLSFVTNNASRTPEQVAAHLTHLGLAGVEPNQVVTSAQAAARLVSQLVQPGDPVLVVGGDGLREAVIDLDLVPVTSVAEQPKAIVQGFSPTLNWEMLAEATIAVRNKIPWIAANLDATLPTSRGALPGNGSFVQLIANITGASPIVAGKPQRHLFDETVRRENSRNPLVVGDRIDTDIQGAVNAQMDSLLVLTGVTNLEQVIRSDVRPTFVAPDLRGITQIHPAVAINKDKAMCGQAVAQVAAGTVQVVTPDAPLLEIVRAIVALAWHYLDMGDDSLNLSEATKWVSGRINP